MSNLSALHDLVANDYEKSHTLISKLIEEYEDGDDLDEYVTRVVSPLMGRTVDPQLFDHALTAYGCVQAVKDGSHEDIHRNRAGTVDNTIYLLDREEDFLDAEIRNVLNSIGIS